MFQSSPQHFNLHVWCLGVDSSKTKASLWKWQRELLPLKFINKGHLEVKWALFEKWCRENSVDFSTPICETSLILLHVPVPRSKQASVNIDGYKTLRPAGFHISQSSDLNCLLPSFPGSSQQFQESPKVESFCS